jgi:TPR repeat protein
MHNLGCCYAKCQGVSQNTAEPAQWFRRSADAGHAAACVSYGKCLLLGINVTNHFPDAMRYLRKETNQEDGNCYVDLENMYQNGERVPVDYDEALKWYRLTV